MRFQKKFKKSRILIILSMFVLLLFVSGQTGCEQGATGAYSTGLDYTLLQGVGFLEKGKELYQGDTFTVGIHMENYDKTMRTGEVCIRDDIADSFGGISSQDRGECKFFNIDSADVITEQTGAGRGTAKEIRPGITDVYFPDYGEYSYHGLPSLNELYDGNLQVILRYRQTTQATGTVTAPGQEQPTISQEPAPISVSVLKAIRKRETGYKIDFDIMLKKIQDARIFTSDFSQENYTFFRAELMPQQMTCKLTSGQPVSGLVEIKNERLIKCSTLISLAGEAQQSYPLVITLDYGVSLERSYKFKINTEEQ